MNHRRERYLKALRERLFTIPTEYLSNDMFDWIDAASKDPTQIEQRLKDVFGVTLTLSPDVDYVKEIEPNGKLEYIHTAPYILRAIIKYLEEEREKEHEKVLRKIKRKAGKTE